MSYKTLKIGSGDACMKMKFQYNDGGRAAAGYKGRAGDCVCRSIAIVTEMPYQEVYDALNEFARSSIRAS